MTRLRDWFVPWELWRLGGKVGPRPNAPLIIPLLAWRLDGWVKWKLGDVASKPAIVGNLKIEPWMWGALRQIKEALRQPPSPPSPVLLEALPMLWISDGFQAGTGTIETLLANLSAGGFRAATFQAGQADNWKYAETVRDANYDVQLWASCEQIAMPALADELNRWQPSRFIAQIETPAELSFFYQYSAAGLFSARPLDVVLTYNIAEARDLADLRVQRTWCEAYLQDGREPVDMCYQASRWWGYPSPMPVIGCYNGVGPTAYNMASFGRNYSVWRWEQCDPAWYPQMP